MSFLRDQFQEVCLEAQMLAVAKGGEGVFWVEGVSSVITLWVSGSPQLQVEYQRSLLAVDTALCTSPGIRVASAGCFTDGKTEAGRFSLSCFPP